VPDELTMVSTFLEFLDLSGTFVFALSGALAGARYRLDIFGMLVLSFVAAVAGGIIRDVLIGATPPAAIDDWRYLAVSVAAGLITFRWYARINRLRSAVLTFDAIGLALFTVTGASKALSFDLDPAGAVLLGMLTGIGGGMLCDLLVSETPAVLRSELYAVAALAGASIVVLGDRLDITHSAALLTGAAVCFTLRILAIRRGWNLPAPRLE